MKIILKKVLLALFAATLCAAVVAGVFCALSRGKSGEFIFNALLQSGFWMSLGFAVMFLAGLYVVLERLWYVAERLPVFIRPATGKETEFAGLGENNLDAGAGLLEFIAGIAPVLGFIGTLIGFMSAFVRLGIGDGLASVLPALSYTMNTSLLGAVISLFFLIAAFILRRLKSFCGKRFPQPPTP